jgi:prepilin signal peptidase PulO-like enzyme (type II secretory pathway)
MAAIITAHKLSNVLLPVAIGGFTYLLNRRSKRLSKKNKKILKILLISSIAIYGYINFNLIAGMFKLVLHKLKNQKTVENMDIDSKNYKLPRTKKIVLALTVTTLILVVIIGFKYFYEPMDEVSRLIKEVEGVEILSPELSERVNKYLLKSSDQRMAEIENNWQQELETFGKELESLGNMNF